MSTLAAESESIGRPLAFRAAGVAYASGAYWLQRNLLAEPFARRHVYAVSVAAMLRTQGVKFALLRNPVSYLIAKSEGQVEADIAAGRYLLAIDFAGGKCRMIAPSEAGADGWPGAILIDMAAVVERVRSRLDAEQQGGESHAA